MREILTDELLDYIGDKYLEAKEKYGDIIADVTFESYLQTVLEVRQIQGVEAIG